MPSIQKNEINYFINTCWKWSTHHKHSNISCHKLCIEIQIAAIQRISIVVFFCLSSFVQIVLSMTVTNFLLLFLFFQQFYAFLCENDEIFGDLLMPGIKTMWPVADAKIILYKSKNRNWMMRFIGLYKIINDYFVIANKPDESNVLIWWRWESTRETFYAQLRTNQ